MVHTSQQVVTEIRRDLFAHIQKLPLSYFDAHTHGELMSRFTNDVDTVQEALNGTFSMLIQSFLILIGPQHAVCFERASDADRITVFSSKRIFYLVQWKMQ